LLVLLSLLAGCHPLVELEFVNNTPFEIKVRCIEREGAGIAIPAGKSKRLKLFSDKPREYWVLWITTSKERWFYEFKDVSTGERVTIPRGYWKQGAFSHEIAKMDVESDGKLYLIRPNANISDKSNQPMHFPVHPIASN